MKKIRLKNKIVIVVPNYNGLEHLKYCLPSILQATNGTIPIALVDDRSTDDSRTWLETFHKEVLWIDNKGKQGFAGSVNSGIKWGIEEQKADYIVVANNDIKLHPLTLTRLLNFLGKQVTDAKIGLIGFREKNPPLTIEDLDDLIPTKMLGAVNRSMSIPGCFFVVSQHAISKVGYFDESYFMYGEDNDFFYRIVTNNLPILQSDFPIWHRGEGSSQGSKKASWLAYRNALKFSFKNHSLILCLRTFLSLLNQGVNPFLKKTRIDPSYLRLSRHSIFVNLGFLLASVAWNFLHIGTTFKSRRVVKRGRR